MVRIAGSSSHLRWSPKHGSGGWLRRRRSGQSRPAYASDALVQRLGDQLLDDGLGLRTGQSADRFAFFHESQRKVNRDGHIEVDRSYPLEEVADQLKAYCTHATTELAKLREPIDRFFDTDDATLTLNNNRTASFPLEAGTIDQVQFRVDGYGSVLLDSLMVVHEADG